MEQICTWANLVCGSQKGGLPCREGHKALMRNITDNEVDTTNNEMENIDAMRQVAYAIIVP
eukprot:scaffold1457_cov102-Skeletonema_marinoi.AAC.2